MAISALRLCSKCRKVKPCGCVVKVDRRESASRRGYDARWRRESEEYKRKNPLCVECLAGGVVTAVFVVDHIIPHRGDKELFWDKSKWQSLCEIHHNRKTARGE